MKSIYKIAGIAMVTIALQSCSTVVQPYEAPQDAINEEFFRTDRIPQDSTTIADVSWREMFTDPLLQGYIDKALENNIDIRVALQQIGIAEAYVLQGKAGFLPTVSGNLQYTFSHPSKYGSQGGAIASTGKRNFSDYTIGGNASWEADIWGKISSQKRVYDANYLQTVAAHRAVKTELIAAVATTYYQLLAIDRQKEVTQETLETRKESMETTRAMKDAGVGNITSIAVQQTEAQYLDAKSFLLDLDQQAHVLENALSILMGEEPHDIQRSNLLDQRINSDLETGVPAQLLANRPDVQAAEANFRSAFEMTNVARTNFYPSLTIGAGVGLNALTFDKWFNGNSLFANVLGGITAPILNGRKIRTQYEVSQIQQEQAKLNYRGVLIQASKEVSDALFAYETSVKKVQLIEEQHQLLERAVADSQELLKSGYNNFSYLEVLSAQQNVLNSSLAVINERVTELTSVVELYRALGGGWK